MRILIDYRPALRSRSGVGEYVHQLVGALARFDGSSPTGRETAALTIFSSSWRDRLVESPDWPAPNRITLVDRRVPVRVLNWTWHRLGWPSAEQLTGHDYDVTHSMHPLILPSRRAAAVVTIHDLNFLTHPEQTRGEIRRDYPRLAQQHAHRADHIIVPSHFTAREVVSRFGVELTHVSVCSPGAPPWRPRDTARLEHADGYILFFGTLEPRKNIGTLLDAFARLVTDRDSRGLVTPELVLAGRHTADAEPWIARASAAPLAGRVRLPGYVDPAKRQALYEGARMLVQPSFEEGFGIPVLEAMTLGIPVVAADRGALPEVLGDAGVLTPATDAAALAHAIDRVLDEPGLARGMAERGLEQSRQFSWHASARRTMDAYRTAVAHRATRRSRS